MKTNNIIKSLKQNNIYINVETFIKNNFPFLLLFLFLFFIHMQLSVTTGDDTGFANLAKSMNLIDFSIEKYKNWSSRQIIEGILYFVSQVGILWKILDSLVITFVAKLIYLIFSKKGNQFKWLSCIFVSVYPLLDMSSAGWIATTVNYYWPLLAILVHVFYMKKEFSKHQLKSYEYLISVLALLLGSNQEQGLAILIGIYFFYVIYLFVNKKKISKYVILNIILLFSIGIYIATCPGNWKRKISETNYWLPSYKNYSIFRKFEMGFSAMMYPMIFKFNPPCLLFSMILLMVGIEQKNSRLKKSAGIIFSINIIFGAFGNYLINLYPNLDTVFYKCLHEYGILNMSDWKSFLPYIVFFVVLTEMMKYWKELLYIDKKNLILISILIIGLGSKFMMCFSPTIWVSSPRTEIFLYFSLIIVSIIMVSKYIFNKRSYTVLEIVMGIIGFCNIINCIS